MTTLLRPALPWPILTVIAAWSVAGVVIMTAALIDVPPVASAAIEVPGWDWLSAAVGCMLTAGGSLVLLSGRRWHRVDWRWTLELTGEALLMTAWTAYSMLAVGTTSWAVACLTVGHAIAAGLRMLEVRREEGLMRHLVDRHAGDGS